VKAKPMTLDLGDIKVDMEIQQRADDGVDADLINEYADLIGAGTEFPRVRVFVQDGEYFLSRGFHRYFAHGKAGRQTIKSDVLIGSRDDAIIDACGANTDHGARRTNEDKRKAVATLNGMFPKRSARWIAERAGVSADMVDRLRLELPVTGSSHSGDAAPEGAPDDQDDTVESRDGSKRKRRKPKRQEPDDDINVPASVPNGTRRYPALELFDQITGAINGLTARATLQYGSLGGLIKSDEFLPSAREGAIHMLSALRRSLVEAIDEVGDGVVK